MKTNRFLSLAIIFAVLMSASFAYAQYVELAVAGGKWLLSKYAEKKEIREQIEELQPIYDAWLTLLEAYIKKTDSVGDCKAIGLKYLPDNRKESGNFYYECGVKDSGNVAFLNVKSKVKIGTCDAKSEFNVEYPLGKTSLDVFSFPVKEACLFLQRSPPLPSSSKAIKPPSPKEIDIDSGGARSRAEIMAVVSQRVRGLDSIYDRYLKDKSGFTGKVTLKFTIIPSGDITDIGIVSSTTDYSEFDNAIKDQVSSWKWKPITSGNATTTIPFTFRVKE